MIILKHACFPKKLDPHQTHAPQHEELLSIPHTPH